MTGLYLTSATADAGVTAGSGTKWKAGFAPGASATHLNKNSAVIGAVPLQMTDGATAGTDGTVVSWYTAPLWGVTIAGAISCLFWTRENATADNVAPSMRIERCDGAGNVLSTIVSEIVNLGSSECATTAGGASDAMNVVAGNTTDTTLSDGDRLRITLWIDNAGDQGGTGNMAAGGRGEFWINGPNGAQGQAQLLFTEVVAPQAGPKILPFETANWTATTTPRTITAAGALSADLIVAMYGGDNFGSQVTAATASTTGGTTGAWTEIGENFGPSSNSAWKSNAWATVTADGDVTASLARTQGSPQVWGGWAALLKNHGGIGNTAQLTNGATETVSLTTSANSIVVALGIDWDDLTNVAMLPPGAHDVERSSGTAVAWYAAFWVGQEAGTRNYGLATSSTANFVITLIEILAPTGGTTVNPTGITTGEAFGSPVVSLGAITASPTGIGSGEAFGTPTASFLTTGSPTGIPSAEVFGTPTATATLTASPTGIATAEAFGTAVLALSLLVGPAGIPSAEAFGTAATSATLTVSPTGIASGAAFGVPTATPGQLTTAPTGIGSREAFGTPVATPGSLTVSPSGIPSGEAFGTVSVTTSGTAAPTGIPSSEAFGAPTVTLGLAASAFGIASLEAFGAPVVALSLTASPTGITSGQAFGTPSVGLSLTAAPVGIPSAQAFGVPAATPSLVVAPGGIPSGEAFGSPMVSGGSVIPTRDLELAGYIAPGRFSGRLSYDLNLAGQLDRGRFSATIAPGRFAGSLKPGRLKGEVTW